VEGCPHGGGIAPSRTSRLERLVYIWVAAAVVLVVSIGAAVARPKSGETAAQPKTILFLHSYGLNVQPWAAWSREIQTELNRQSPWPLVIQEQPLVTAGAGDTTETKFVEYLATLYAQRPPDLIVAVGTPAAQFMQRHRPNLYPTTPMLLAAVEVRRVEPSMLSEQDAVAGIHLDEVALFRNILRLLPETQTIALISGNSPNARFWVDEQKQILGPLLGNKVKLIFFYEQPFEETLKEIAKLPPHSAIFFQMLVVEGARAMSGDKEPLKRIDEVGTAPIFSFDETFFTGAVVGGPMFSSAGVARPTAAAAVRMLGGERASSIEVPVIGFSAPKYDWRQLQRWNISESRLPPGSEILFREPTAWDRYSWQIALTTIVILLQGALIAALLREHRRRQLAEVQSAQRSRELALASRFATAGELTASIAHELNQPLGAILTNAETAQAILKSQSQDIAERPDIIELSDIVDDILHDDQRASEVIRRMRSLLKRAPFDPKNYDFNEVVRETVGLFSAVAAGRKVELASFLAPIALPVICDHIQLQQVIINLVGNAIEAMKDTPTEVRIISIQTSRVEKFAELSVSDRGHGILTGKLKEVFEPFYTSKAEGMGMGLSIARTIIEAHNGQIWAENQDRGGATFRIRLPLVS
jgi:signal transduction histidine kinase